MRFGFGRQECKGFRHGGFGRGEGGFEGHRHGGFGRGEGHEGFGRHWGRGRGGARPFDHGELKLVVLAMIAEKPRHGYEIIKAIEDRFGGSYTPSPGVVYPTLTLLEELGQATVEETGGKKLYTITELGREFLKENQAAVNAAMERMQAIGEAHGGGPAPQLIRALGNFRMALQMRQRRGPLTDEQLRAIVAAIDAAAVAIERS